MPEFAVDLKNALFTLRALTPFAWLAVFGAATAALGVAAMALVGAEQDLENAGHEYDPPDADDPRFRYQRVMLGVFQNGFYVFLGGVALTLIGVYPFVAAAAAAR